MVGSLGLAEFGSSGECGYGCIYVSGTGSCLAKTEVGIGIIGVHVYDLLIFLHGLCILLLVEQDVALLHVKLGNEALGFRRDIFLTVLLRFFSSIGEYYDCGVNLVGCCELLAYGADEGRNVPPAVVGKLISLWTYYLGLGQCFFKISKSCLFVSGVEGCGPFVVQ